LKPWGERKSRAEQYQEIKESTETRNSAGCRSEPFSVFSPPAVPGVGTSGGFQFVLEDRSGKDVKFLSDNLNKFLAAARKRPEIGLVTSTFIPSVPEEYINVDRDKVLKTGLRSTMCTRRFRHLWAACSLTILTSSAVRAGLCRGRAPYRSNTQDLGQFYVRNSQGQNVPLSALANFETRYGPEFTLRYNEYRSAAIIGSAAPGYSSEQATAALEMSSNRTMPTKWASTHGHVLSGAESPPRGPAWAIFGLSLLFVFLVLAALYESWSLPWSVLLSTPVAVFGALGRALACAALCSAGFCRRTWFRWRTMYTPDWSSDAHRSGCQEFNSDRRVRQRGVRTRQASVDAAWTERGFGSGPHDDRARLHCRVRATLDSIRSGRHRAPDLSVRP